MIDESAPNEDGAPRGDDPVRPTPGSLAEERLRRNLRRLSWMLAGQAADGAARADGLASARRAQLDRARRNMRILAEACAASARQAEARSLHPALLGAGVVDYSASIGDAEILGAARVGFDPSLPTILFLVHALGGGTYTHLERLTAALADRANVLILRGDTEGLFRLGTRLRLGGGGLRFQLPSQMADLVRLLRGLGVARVDVHHVQGFEDLALSVVEALGVPHDVTLVDYDLLARDPHLCGPDGRFIGDDRLLDPASGMLRPEPSPILSRAERVVAISRDLAARVRRIDPGLAVICARSWIRPRPEDRPVTLRPLAEGESLRILVPGTLQPHKGQRILLETARLAADHRMPFEFHVLGALPAPERLLEGLDGVLVRHGPYRQGDFLPRLRNIGPHLGWLPALAPETWSYALSDLMEAGLPIAASALGAIVERCHGRPATWLLPHDDPPGAWAELFGSIRDSALTLPPRWPAASGLPEAEDFYFDRYLEPVRPM